MATSKLKSEIPLSNKVLSWKQLGLFVRVRPIAAIFLWFLQYAGFVIKSSRLFRVQKPFIDL